MSGPVAITAGASKSRESTSFSMISISGSFFICSVTAFGNSSLSTARAPPAGTRVLSAHIIIREPMSRSSSLSRPIAFDKPSARKEFEQQSSQKRSELCAGMRFFGFISIRRTFAPLFAACHAASQPARPAPTTYTVFFSKFFSFKPSCRRQRSVSAP